METWESSAPRLGFFEPRGVFWKVSRENVLMLGAGCAILLQIAHPLVAAGVDDYSDYREHPLRRLYRTLRAVQHLVCRGGETALRMSERLRSVHGRVTGTLEDATALFPAGTRYHASQPELLLWVHATLIEATFITHDCFLPPLSVEERGEYYGTSKRLGALFGVPGSILPPDYAAYRDYFDAMVAGPTLAVTPTALRLAEAVLEPRVRWLPPLLWRWNRLITTALLPQEIRRRYGLPWDEERAATWSRFRERTRRLLSRTPDFLRAAPCWQWAELRWKWTGGRVSDVGPSVRQQPNRPA